MRHFRIHPPHQHVAFRTSIRMLRIAWDQRPLAIVGYFVGSLLEITSMIGTIYATSQIGALLAHYITGGDTSTIWFWLSVDIAAAIGTALGFWLMNMCRQLLYFRLTKWSIEIFLGALSSLDISDFYDEETRNRINKAQNGYMWQMPGFAEIVLDLVYALLRFTATAFIVSQITWWLIPLLAVFLIPTLLAEKNMAQVQWFVWDEKGDNRHIFWGLEWIIRQAKEQMELRSSQARAYVLGKIAFMNADFYATQEKQFRRVNRFMVPSKILEASGTAIGSIVLLRQFIGGLISLDRYFFLSGALLRIGGSLNNVFSTLSRMQERILFVENFFQVIDTQPKIVDKPNAYDLHKTDVPTIQFKNVSFTYPGQEIPVFNDLNFTLKPGEHVALVGENGAGKSTIIKLLLRFYVPTDGQIIINGHDLQDIAIESWYSQLATLFQDFIRYPLPLVDNIEIADPKSAGNAKQLADAAAFSNVDTFVNKYKHGWNTVLDNSFEKGVEPSGGQWQRVALARAFYRHSNILILDEPTSAIDANAEYDIFNNIFEHYQGKTTIIVSHRFSTVRRAHRIIVIDNGKIIEHGSHEKLMEQKGLYAEMFQKQAEGYK